jgi:hypothetical protein
MDDDHDPYERLNPPVLTARDLFGRALLEVDTLGTQPRSGPARWHFDEERRGSLLTLADLAGHDGHLLHRAALHLATGPRHRHVKAARILHDATRFAWRDSSMDSPW